MSESEILENTAVNPFVAGDPVLPEHFVGRKQELNEITSYITSHGQSTAIVGEPRTGKTSLLLYLASSKTRETLYGKFGQQLMFSFVDCQALAQQCDWAEFWRETLHPFNNAMTGYAYATSLASTYRKVCSRDFDRLSLEEFFEQLHQADQRLVLLLDEFDALLQHPGLNKSSFFGGLRTLTSRYRALVLVTASRVPIEYLQRQTLGMSGTASPYFNFFAKEVVLGSLENEDILTLWERAGEQLTGNNRRHIMEWAGGHPYLLQAAANALWNAFSRTVTDPHKRREQAQTEFYNTVKGTLLDTWTQWTPSARCAFTIAALPQMEGMSQVLKQVSLLNDKNKFDKDFQWLHKHGFVVEDQTTPGGWCVRPEAFTWWLKDEIKNVIHDERPYEDWLREHKREGLLTKGEKQWFDKATRTVGKMLQDGIKAFIEATARGLGEAIYK